ncbi:MAG: hypothetical protein U0N90_01390 [Blautia sp.]|jgi:hypothetical protein
MNKSKGIGIASVLTLIFVVLKLTELIDWSWVWVLSPIWIPSLLWAISFTIILIGGRIKRKKR